MTNEHDDDPTQPGRPRLVVTDEPGSEGGNGAFRDEGDDAVPEHVSAAYLRRALVRCKLDHQQAVEGIDALIRIIDEGARDPLTRAKFADVADVYDEIAKRYPGVARALRRVTP